MAEEDKKKLEIALQLKRALERDLERIGKYKPREKKESRTKYTPQSRQKPVTIDFSKVKNLRDVDEQDYDAPDPDLLSAIRKSMSSANIERRISLQVLSNLIEGKCYEVSRQLEGSRDPELLYNLWECNLFEGKITLHSAFKLLKDFPGSPVAMLFLAEVLLFAYNAFLHSEKILSTLFEIFRNPRLGFLLSMYRAEKNAAAEYLGELTRTGQYKDALPIYLLLHLIGHGDETKMEPLRKLVSERKHNACAMAALALENLNRRKLNPGNLQQLAAQFPFCKVLSNIAAYTEAAEGKEFESFNVDEPTRLKLHIARAVNNGKSERTKELTARLAEMFGEFQLTLGIRENVTERKGLLLHKDELRQATTLKISSGVDVARLLFDYAEKSGESYSKVDYVIETPEIEFLRLVWGWRVCQRMY
ncbi:MAG: hypothetical protein PWP37_166 [Thermotogota bacterium]|nr:hypothetical protein [Thermotogota bacterium]MDK2863974.1 hypothetical protein [Thermotogota bacterium]HCZ06360.1 hypothetical protein [Thermotogota bacterium]